MKHKFKLTRLWVASLLLFLGISPNVWANKTIYLIPNSDWKSSSAWFQVWDGSSNINFTETSISGVFQASIKDEAGDICLKRMGKENNQDKQWNYWNTNASTNNRFEVTGWDNSGNASKIIGLVTGGHIYVDNSVTQWTTNKNFFAVGHDSYTKLGSLSPISGTQLLYGQPNGTWSDANYFALMGNSAWDLTEDSKGYNWLKDASNYSAKYTGSYDLNSGSTYLVTPQSNAAQGATINIDYLRQSYSDIPKYTHTLNVYTRTSIDGVAGDYDKTSKNSPTSVTLTGKKLNGNGTATNATATVNTSAKTASVSDVVMTSTLTGSYTALAQSSAWVFDGWSESSDGTNLSNTYSKSNVKAATTVNAFFTLRKYTVTFAAKGEGIDKNTVTAKINSSAITSGNSYDYGSKVIFTATPYAGYQIEGWYSDADCTQSLNNGTNTTYTINSLTATTSVYVKFKTQEYSVTFGVGTDCTSLGSVKASVNDGAAQDPGTYSIGASSKIVFTASPITGYHVAGWYSDPTCSQEIAGAGTGTSYTITSLSKAETVYVKFAANTYSVKFNGNGNTGGSMENQSFTYDEAAKALKANAFVKMGYAFQGWAKSTSGEVEYTDGQLVSNLTDANNATVNLYAKWQINTYNITYPASPEHYTINTEAPKTADFGTTASFTVTPDKGYLVDVTAIKTGSATSVTLQRNGNTYTIQSMPAYDVTINVTAHKFKLNGWDEHSSDKEFDANWEYKENLSALTTYEFKLHNTADGLNNNGYFGNNGTIESTITSGWTMSDSEGTKLTLKTGIAGTYTFTYCEVEENGVMKPQIMVKFPEVSKLTYNSTDYAFTALGDGTYIAGPIKLNPQEGNETQYNIDFLWDGSYYRNDNSNYMTAASHTNWGYVTTQETNNGLRIQVPTNEFVNTPDDYSFIWNPSTKQMTAVYPSYFRGSSTIGWGFANPMTFNASGEYTYVYTHGEDADETIEVKIIDEGRYYSYNKTATTSDEVEFSPSETQSYKVEMVKSMPGDYVFTYNKNNHHMIVTYPDKETFPVDVYLDGVTKTTMQVGPEGGRHIEAADKPGYRFNGWELTNENTSVTVADNDKSRKSTTLYAKAAGGVVRATYSNDEFIYFKNNPGWSSVSVYFYNGDYFNETSGTGCVAKWKENNQDKEDRKAQGYAMTRIPNSDIWYLDYKNVAWKPGDKHIIAFADDYQNDAQWFDHCQVTYRKDFYTCMPLFSPVNYIHRYLNKHDNQQTCYYDQGHWMKYDSQESGYTLRIYSGYQDAEQKAEVAMVADYAGGYSFRGSVTLPVDGDQPGHVYGFKLNGCNDSYFGNNGEMNSGNCSNWEFNPSSEMHNCGLKTTSKGEYIFTMSFSGGVMHVSVEYPLSNNDYRVVYSDNQGEIWNGLYYKNSTEDKLDTASFYIKNGIANAVVKLQKCTDASTSPVTWGEVQSIDVSSYETGVYNFKIAQTSSTATLSKIGAYTGNYYIRSKALDGGLEGYEANADNRMNYTTANPAFAADNQQGYNYYKTRWITIGKDVAYTVANDYSKNISATMTGDGIIGNDTQTLPADANVRFTWNSNTNALSRAYIKGSSNAGDKFVQVYGTYVYSDQECTILLTENDPGLFKDNQDWVYEYTMYAKTGATATVKTDYNKQEQLLISNQAVFSSTKDNDVAKLRALYDFKTNRFVAAWTPPTTAITSEYSINADIMLMRNGQQQADQMTFSGEGSITGEPKTIYGAVKFDKTLMETPGTYDRSIFWISFPFDVRLNDVFGLGQYGKYWIIRYYDGAERASKGWFQETKTFWKTVSVEEREHGGTDGKGFVLKANEGYNLVLDYTAVLKDLYPNGATENYLFFPSKDKLTNILASLLTESITYPALTCTITSPENRTNEDSNWRVIGVPSYADPGTITAAEGIKFFYAWNRANNTLGVDKVGTYEGTFQSMHAYMVQFAGTINWSTRTVTPATAPLFANNDKEEYSLRLELQQEGKKVDQAYVDLTDEATEEFDLNLDITKLMYSTSQIYSFIGNDKVAANSLPVRDVVVPLCVTAAADGTYTIALPDGTEGLNVTLYDVTAGKETNMSFDGYMVNLDKGEYNNRFLLNISVPRVPTNIRNANGEWSVDGKTKKLLINDNIYLINAGRIYNVLGVGE